MHNPNKTPTASGIVVEQTISPQTIKVPIVFDQVWGKHFYGIPIIISTVTATILTILSIDDHLATIRRPKRRRATCCPTDAISTMGTYLTSMPWTNSFFALLCLASLRKSLLKTDVRSIVTVSNVISMVTFFTQSHSTINYTCECPLGYNGLHCEQSVSSCANNPCENEGSCVDGPSGYLCMCKRGFSGKKCKVSQKGCNPNPCLNGKCNLLIADFKHFKRFVYLG